jgi:hypothetical protein
MFAPPPTKVAALRAIPKRMIRFTVASVVSSWCALAVIAVAAPARAESPRSTADPQSLSAELNAEFQLVYRDNVPEFTRRSEQLRQAIDVWNASSKNAADRTEMTAWLRESIRLSMPGSIKPLPPVPMLVRDTVQPNPASKSVLAAKSVASKPRAAKPATPRDSSESDPFRDDPVPDPASIPSR